MKHFFVCQRCIHSKPYIKQWMSIVGTHLAFQNDECSLCGNSTLTYFKPLDLLRLTVTQFQNPKYTPEVSHTSALTNGLIGMATESAEVLDEWKKHAYQHHPFDVDKVTIEIGDVLYYIQLTCWALDISIEDCIVAMSLKLQNRFGDSFSADKSIKREN